MIYEASPGVGAKRRGARISPDVRAPASTLSESTFSELFAGGGRRPCLTLFEMRRYTKLSLRLAEAAREAGLPIIILCDSHCYWARDYSELVLSVSTESHLFWDSQAPFLTLGNLLLDAIISRLGDSVEGRVRKMRALQERFDAFHG